MKAIIITSIFILCTSCIKQTQHNNIEFNTIDISYSNGWDYPYTTWIDNKGNIVIFSDNQRQNKFAYAKLPLYVIDSLFVLVKKTNFNGLDASYIQNCEDCRYYNIIINKNEVFFSLYVYGFENNNKLKDIDNLVYYIQDLTRQIVENQDNIIF